MSYSKEFLLKLYTDLVRCRKIEEKTIELYSLGKFPGHIHSGFGEEAVFVGTCATMIEGDWMKPTHRSVSSLNLKGISLKEIFTDCMGKSNGPSKGHGGIIHIARKDKGVLGISGSLGCDIAVGVGAGISCKTLDDGRITYVFFGEGTSNRGPFHEALNLASVWKLPVVFICNNNQYAISTHISSAMAIENVADRAISYGMPYKIAEGNEVLNVYESAKELVDYVRAGNGPALLETKSYRIRGHFEGDQAAYRSKEITEEWASKCCVKSFENVLFDKGLLTPQLVENIGKEIDDELVEAIDYAEQSPEPLIKDIYYGLYS